MNIGAGFISYKGESHYTFPVQINYLKGFKRKPALFFEVGAGATFHNYGVFKNIFYLLRTGPSYSYNPKIVQEEDSVYGVFVLAIRRIPIHNDGIFLRFSNTTLFSKDGVAPFYPSVSIGLSFGFPRKRKRLNNLLNQH
jgi:hypothetical protein